MKKWVKRAAIAVSSVLVVAGASVVATGVGQADEQGDYLRVTLHWNINLTDVGDKTCAQSSSQVAIIPPGNNETIVMVAPMWRESCGEVQSRVNSTVRRDAQGIITVAPNLAAQDGTSRIEKQGEIKISQDNPTVESTDLKLDSSSTATAFGHFYAGVVKLSANEAVSFTREFRIDKDGVEGTGKIQLFRTGQWIFSGRMHNTNFESKDVKLHCGLEYKFQKGLYFDVVGDLNGTLASVGGSKSIEWSQNGTNHDLNSIWQGSNLDRGVALVDCDMPVETDTGNDVAATILIVFKVLDFLL